MNREQVELLVFKLSIVDKHIKNFVNLLHYQIYTLDKPEDEMSETDSQTLIYQLDNLERMCGMFFTDAFTLKQIQQLKNDEIMKEIHKDLENSKGQEDGI